jgi:predicted nuclease of predicted toxin-antitoxin system
MTELAAVTFFIDRAIGKKHVPEVLRDSGANIEVHADWFEQDAPDIEWLPIVSQKGWVIITKDERIGRNPLELMAIAESQARVFIFVSGNLKRQQMAEALVQAMAKMTKIAQSNKAPFIAKVYRNGNVNLWRKRSQLMKLQIAPSIDAELEVSSDTL